MVMLRMILWGGSGPVGSMDQLDTVTIDHWIKYTVGMDSKKAESSD
jgi:hypothetical protein